MLESYNPLDKSRVWADPCSLVATKGISFDFFSSGYLDISVLQVTFPLKAEQRNFHCARFPYSDTAGSSDVDSSPARFAINRVLPRLETPKAFIVCLNKREQFN